MKYLAVCQGKVKGAGYLTFNVDVILPEEISIKDIRLLENGIKIKHGYDHVLLLNLIPLRSK